MDRTHAKTRKHAVAVGILHIVLCYILGADGESLKISGMIWLVRIRIFLLKTLGQDGACDPFLCKWMG